MQAKPLIALVVISVGLTTTYARAVIRSDSVMIAVLEVQRDSTSVRPLFKKHGRDWEPFANQLDEKLRTELPQSGDWAVLHNDGKAERLRSVLDSQAWREQRDVGRHVLMPRTSTPPRGAGSARQTFSFWDGVAMIESPAMLSTGRYAGSTGKWQASKLTAAETARFRARFRELVPEVPRCNAKGIITNPAAHYSDDAIRATVVFRSKSGRMLAGLVLDPTSTCTGPVDAAGSIHWMAGVPGVAPSFIGNQMQLVDKVDCDGDGHSEWLFFLTARNENGYALFYDDFQRSARMTWTYQ